MNLKKKTITYLFGYFPLYITYIPFTDVFTGAIRLFWDLIEPHQSWLLPIILAFAHTLGFFFGGVEG